MNGHTTTMRTLRPPECAAVSGGYDSAELMGYVAAGAAIGVAVGQVLLAPLGAVGSTVLGGAAGGFWGAGFYAASELIDYCF